MLYSWPSPVIDLYADGFNPVMTRDGLAAVTSDHVADPLIERYTSMLQRTDRAIFIFPIWWGMMPAMLKGFMDRAFVKGRIYDITDNGEIMPCLSVERTLIVTTSEGDSVDFGPFVSGYLAPMVLEPVGFGGCQWLDCQQTDSGSPERRREFIGEVLKRI